MTPRDWFDVFVRVIGVVVLVYGLWDLVNAALFYTEYFKNPDMTFRFYMLFGWSSILIGLLLIRVSRVVVNYAYGPLEDEPGSAEAEDGE